MDLLSVPPPAPRFWYDPLDQSTDSIRLLEILPGTLGPIRCNIRSALLGSNHMCLSYLLGSPGNEQSILVNGKICYVRTNLWDFLNSAQPKYAGLLLWIDAICINQEDDREKSRQVGIMGRIYANSQLVLTWLGRAIYEEGEWNRVLHYTEILRHQKWPCRTTSQHPSRHALPREYSSWMRIKSLFYHQYWTRTWVFQELKLASRILVLHGQQEIAWSELDLIWKSSRDGSLFSSSLSCRDTPCRKYLGSAFGVTDHVEPLKLHSQSLSDVLWENLGSTCSKFQDRLFSVLSLVREGRNYMVDYKLDKLALFAHTIRTCVGSCLCFIRPLAKAFFGPDDSAHQKIRELDQMLDKHGRERPLIEIKLSGAATVDLLVSGLREQAGRLQRKLCGDVQTLLPVKKLTTIPSISNQLRGVSRFEDDYTEETVKELQATGEEDIIVSMETQTSFPGLSNLIGCFPGHSNGQCSKLVITRGWYSLGFVRHDSVPGAKTVVQKASMGITISKSSSVDGESVIQFNAAALFVLANYTTDRPHICREEAAIGSWKLCEV